MIAGNQQNGERHEWQRPGAASALLVLADATASAHFSNDVVKPAVANDQSSIHSAAGYGGSAPPARLPIPPDAITR
jgi:hypothetical protein